MQIEVIGISMDKSTEKTSISLSKPLARLVWEEGGEHQERAVGGAGLTIGRTTDNDLTIADLQASRFHCKVMPEAEGFIVVDVGSSNGTFINNERVEESHALLNGDKLQIGQLEFSFEILTQEPVVETPTDEGETMPLEETYVVPVASEVTRLVVSSGVGKGTEYPLTKKRMQIGRASRNKQWDIDLIDRTVSRPHAELVRQGEKWVLTDLGSANGTTLNNERIIEPSPLQDGDTVGIGETILIFRIGLGA